jgi:hypothetical protein
LNLTFLRNDDLYPSLAYLADVPVSLSSEEAKVLADGTVAITVSFDDSWASLKNSISISLMAPEGFAITVPSGTIPDNVTVEIEVWEPPFVEEEEDEIAFDTAEKVAVAIGVILLVGTCVFVGFIVRWKRGQMEEEACREAERVEEEESKEQKEIAEKLEAERQKLEKEVQNIAKKEDKVRKDEEKEAERGVIDVGEQKQNEGGGGGSEEKLEVPDKPAEVLEDTKPVE